MSDQSGTSATPTPMPSLTSPTSSPLIVIHKVDLNASYYNSFDSSEIMHKLSKIYRAVKEDTAVEEYLTTYNAELKKQIEDLLSGVTLPPEVQAKVDKIYEKLTAATKKQQDVLDENKSVS